MAQIFSSLFRRLSTDNSSSLATAGFHLSNQGSSDVFPFPPQFIVLKVALMLFKFVTVNYMPAVFEIWWNDCEASHGTSLLLSQTVGLRMIDAG